MGNLQWNQNLSVDIRQIDDQHQELIKMIIRLEEAAADGRWTKKIVTLSDVLLELADYLQYHFSAEEKLMIDYDYPEVEAHRNAHEKFVGEMVLFTEDFRAGKKGLSVEILDFLKEWVLDHIMTVDTSLGEYLRERGVE